MSLESEDWKWVVNLAGDRQEPACGVGKDCAMYELASTILKQMGRFTK
jgi:hypothetical protein